VSRVVEVRALPDGRYRVHYFVFDPEGPCEVPNGMVKTKQGASVRVGGSIPTPEGDIVTRGYIACEPERKSVLPDGRRGTIRLCIKSDDPRAVTCDLCMATEQYRAAMAELATLVTPPNVGPQATK
jgi:hypothetical protein